MQGGTSPRTIVTDNRRQFDRVVGPFDGRRKAALDTPVQIYDLSEGGCFINSLIDSEKGRLIVLEIHLPYEGWIAAKAETLYDRPGFGFAVRFVEMNDDARAKLRRTLAKLRDLASSEF